ncbi:MAG: hypothetical protein U0S50_03420 [Sphingopyxis sp.]|uniref:hypothetical protein n=1 Tax=Sphingopyxis sp. TaxID=1908224 RepID=UPI002ABCC9F1|nr:hypothetical protein [Sphingopyxis sp.]MDZ3830853.1 hypothetical protein [Sphingopyxis sp.]
MARVLGAVAVIVILGGCGNSDQAPGATETAATGIAETVKSAAAERPIPRDNLPDFVETYAGGRYATATFGDNSLRRSGMLLYSAGASPADVAAFHEQSMRKFGFDPGPPQTSVVRDNKETLIEGKHADGRSLSVVVIEQSPSEAMVKLNFIVPHS